MSRMSSCRVALFLALWLCGAAWAAGISVVFINPGRADEPYWRSVTRFMQPAAQQLGMDLEVIYAERDHTYMVEIAKAVARRAKKPDYLIIVNEKATGGEMLRAAEQAHIKTLLAFSTFDDPAQAKEFGTPRKQFKYWLGSITPNAYQAGRLSGADLARQAHALRRHGTAHVAMVGGDKATPTGVQRFEGALQAMAGVRGVAVDYMLYAGWDRDRARQQVRALLLRDPQVSAIWTASDLMAYGAMDAAESAGRHPGRDLLIATFNNSPEVLAQRANGRIASLTGGHFTAGGWALVMLYDYHHGTDFAPLGLQLRMPLFSLIDSPMAERFLSRYRSEDFSSVDFRAFSRHLHPEQKQYRFGLGPLLN